MCLKPDIKDVKSPLLNIIAGPGIGEFRGYVRNIFLFVEIVQNLFIRSPGKYFLTLFQALSQAWGSISELN